MNQTPNPCPMRAIGRYETDLVIFITFAGHGNTGDQIALGCNTDFCGSGCHPKMDRPLGWRRGSECVVLNDYRPSEGQVPLPPPS